jgi:CRP-like cAMP-binding protein
MPASLIDCLQAAGPIPEADRAAILAAWQPRRVSEGETLFAAGHICQERFFIEEGVLRIMVQQPSGKEVTHFFLKEGQLCTILHSFENQVPAAESIQAACAAQVRAVTRARLDELYQQLPYLRAYVSQITQQALLEKIQTRNAYLGHDSTTRYQQFLQHQPDIALRVPLADVASYLGITPQSLSRIRKNIR